MVLGQVVKEQQRALKQQPALRQELYLNPHNKVKVTLSDGLHYTIEDQVWGWFKLQTIYKTEFGEIAAPVMEVEPEIEWITAVGSDETSVDVEVDPIVPPSSLDLSPPDPVVACSSGSSEKGLGKSPSDVPPPPSSHKGSR